MTYFDAWLDKRITQHRFALPTGGYRVHVIDSSGSSCCGLKPQSGTPWTFYDSKPLGYALCSKCAKFA